MANINFYVISTLCMVVLFGSLPCRSNECTRHNINKCTPSSLDDFCVYFGTSAKCLDDLKKNCTDDTLIEDIAERLSRHNDYSEQCPGLPEGECYFSSLQRCQDKVPVNVKYQTNLSAKNKKEMCDHFKGKPDGIKACLKTLKSYCTSEHAIESADFAVTVVEDIEKICAGLEEE